MQVKQGYIISISTEDNLGVIREDSTLTEWLFFLDELAPHQLKRLKVNTPVSFVRDDAFEQFVAQEVLQTEITTRRVG